MNPRRNLETEAGIERQRVEREAKRSCARRQKQNGFRDRVAKARGGKNEVNVTRRERRDCRAKREQWENRWKSRLGVGGESLIPLVGGVRRYLQLGILLQKVHVPGTASHRTGHRPQATGQQNIQLWN